MKVLIELKWKCTNCQIETSTFSPDHESTHVSDNIDVDLPAVNTTYTISAPDSLHPNTLPSFEIPERINESSFADPLPAPDTVDSDDETGCFEIVCDGSQKGKDKLVEKTGFTYVVGRHGTNVTYWCCGVGSKALMFPVSVSQKGDNFYTRQALPQPSC